MNQAICHSFLRQIDGEFCLAGHTPGVDAGKLLQWELQRLTAILQDFPGGGSFWRKVDANTFNDGVASGCLDGLMCSRWLCRWLMYIIPVVCAGLDRQLCTDHGGQLRHRLVFKK